MQHAMDFDFAPSKKIDETETNDLQKKEPTNLLKIWHVFDTHIIDDGGACVFRHFHIPTAASTYYESKNRHTFVKDT